MGHATRELATGELAPDSAAVSQSASDKLERIDDGKRVPAGLFVTFGRAFCPHAAPSKITRLQGIDGL